MCVGCGGVWVVKPALPTRGGGRVWGSDETGLFSLKTQQVGKMEGRGYRQRAASLVYVLFTGSTRVARAG